MHIDCKQNRTDAATGCRICYVEIGYERGFYREAGGRLVHASCLEDEVERQQKRRHAGRR